MRHFVKQPFYRTHIIKINKVTIVIKIILDDFQIKKSKHTQLVSKTDYIMS